MLHIRADGNGEIGTGHLMRCMEIAKAYEKLTGPVQFLVADENSKTIVENSGFSCHVLHSAWNHLEEEIPKIKVCAEELEITCLLIDSYFVSDAYIKAWKELGVKVAYLDDLCRDSYAVDALFNGAIWANPEVYEPLYGGAQTKLFLGCDYLPLRSEFTAMPEKKVRDHAENVLVLSGGTDPCHFLLQFVKNLPKTMECYRFYLVCGMFNNDYDELMNLCRDKQNVQILRNVPDIYRYMQMADVAVSAGGMTLYELCACGTDCITYLLADNQRGNIDGFLEAGLFETIDDIRQGVDFRHLFGMIKDHLTDCGLRLNVAQRVQCLVDGRGADCIARKLGEL